MSDTDTPEPAEATPEPADTPDTDTTPEPAEAPEPADTKAAKEAARYRRRLREVEAERDRLAARLEAMQRAEIERLSLAEHRVKGAALWAAGYTVGDLIGDDGRPDEAKVAAAAAETAERFGIDRRGPGVYVPSEGKTPPDPLKSMTWDRLLHPHRP